MLNNVPTSVLLVCAAGVAAIIATVWFLLRRRKIRAAGQLAVAPAAELPDGVEVNLDGNGEDDPATVNPPTLPTPQLPPRKTKARAAGPGEQPDPRLSCGMDRTGEASGTLETGKRKAGTRAAGGTPPAPAAAPFAPPAQRQPPLLSRPSRPARFVPGWRMVAIATGAAIVATLVVWRLSPDLFGAVKAKMASQPQRFQPLTSEQVVSRYKAVQLEECGKCKLDKSKISWRWVATDDGPGLEMYGASCACALKDVDCLPFCKDVAIEDGSAVYDADKCSCVASRVVNVTKE